MARDLSCTHLAMRRSGQEKLREKHTSGLNREDLVFCGD